MINIRGTPYFDDDLVIEMMVLQSVGDNGNEVPHWLAGEMLKIGDCEYKGYPLFWRPIGVSFRDGGGGGV